MTGSEDKKAAREHRKMKIRTITVECLFLLTACLRLAAQTEINPANDPSEVMKKQLQMKSAIVRQSPSALPQDTALFRRNKPASKQQTAKAGQPKAAAA
jgi:hypothetical protein